MSKDDRVYAVQLWLGWYEGFGPQAVLVGSKDEHSSKMEDGVRGTLTLGDTYSLSYSLHLVFEFYYVTLKKLVYPNLGMGIVLVRLIVAESSHPTQPSIMSWFRDTP